MKDLILCIPLICAWAWIVFYEFYDRRPWFEPELLAVAIVAVGLGFAPGEESCAPTAQDTVQE